MNKDLQLDSILPGIWDSPVMILEFGILDSDQSGTGQISSAGNERTMSFEYWLDREQTDPALIISTPATGPMTYLVRDWKEDMLTLIKEGYSSETIFRKRAVE